MKNRKGSNILLNDMINVFDEDKIQKKVSIRTSDLKETNKIFLKR